MKMSLRSFANMNRGIGIQAFNGQRFFPKLGVSEKSWVAMQGTYWIYKNGHQSGPFKFSKIQSMLQAGTINVTDQIRRPDQQEWHTIGNISPHLEWDHNKLRFTTVPTIMLVFLGLAFIWSFALVWRMYR